VNVTLLAYGSRGDVQPFVALACGLQRAGHAPLLAAPERFAALAAAHGVPFAPLAGDPAVITEGLASRAGHNFLHGTKLIFDYVVQLADSDHQRAPPAPTPM
jgi:sterol 3beta-glucosyltransferase